MGQCGLAGVSLMRDLVRTRVSLGDSATFCARAVVCARANFYGRLGVFANA